VEKYASARSKPGREVPLRTRFPAPHERSRPAVAALVKLQSSRGQMAESLAAFVIAAFALTGSPGPATLGLSAAGAAFGPRRSLALMSGIIVGVLIVFAAAAAGLTGLILAQPLLGPIVKALSVAYMLWLAWSIASAPPLSDGVSADAPSFWGGMFLGVGNPKAYAAMAALSSGFVLATEARADALLKGTILLAVMIVVDIAWLRAGSALARTMRRPVWSRAINIVFALALLASVAAGLM
jgi:threonine/homoserine/homoserine lactone efflux protein